MVTVTIVAWAFRNLQSSAVEAACVILSVDETVRNPKSETDSGQQAMRGPGAMRGRGMR
jgi:T-complex protein 1 subunit eta